jgi:hypothetical protein
MKRLLCILLATPLLGLAQPTNPPAQSATGSVYSVTIRTNGALAGLGTNLFTANSNLLNAAISSSMAGVNPTNLPGTGLLITTNNANSHTFTADTNALATRDFVIATSNGLVTVTLNTSNALVSLLTASLERHFTPQFATNGAGKVYLAPGAGVTNWSFTDLTVAGNVTGLVVRVDAGTNITAQTNGGVVTINGGAGGAGNNFTAQFATNGAGKVYLAPGNSVTNWALASPAITDGTGNFTDSTLGNVTAAGQFFLSLTNATATTNSWLVVNAVTGGVGSVSLRDMSAASLGWTRGIYHAVRTDGRDGTGTLLDPYDVSTATKFNTRLRALYDAGTTYFLYPSTNYQCTNYVIFVDDYTRLEGIGDVVINMPANVGGPQAGTANGWWLVIQNDSRGVIGAEMKNITIECNGHLNTIETNALGGVSLHGHGLRLDNVRVRNPMGNYPVKESWGIIAWAAQPRPEIGWVGGNQVLNCSVIGTNGTLRATNKGYVTGISAGVTGFGLNSVTNTLVESLIHNCTVIGPSPTNWAAFNVGNHARITANRVANVEMFGYQEAHSGPTHGAVVGNEGEKMRGGIYSPAANQGGTNLVITDNRFKVLPLTNGAVSTFGISVKRESAGPGFFDLVVKNNHIEVDESAGNWLGTPYEFRDITGGVISGNTVGRKALGTAVVVNVTNVLFGQNSRLDGSLIAGFPGARLLGDATNTGHLTVTSNLTVSSLASARVVVTTNGGLFTGIAVSDLGISGSSAVSNVWDGLPTTNIVFCVDPAINGLTNRLAQNGYRYYTTLQAAVTNALTDDPLKRAVVVLVADSSSSSFGDAGIPHAPNLTLLSVAGRATIGTITNNPGGQVTFHARGPMLITRINTSGASYTTPGAPGASGQNGGDVTIYGDSSVVVSNITAVGGSGAPGADGSGGPGSDGGSAGASGGITLFGVRVNTLDVTAGDGGNGGNGDGGDEAAGNGGSSGSWGVITLRDGASVDLLIAPPGNPGTQGSPSGMGGSGSPGTQYVDFTLIAWDGSFISYAQISAVDTLVSWVVPTGFRLVTYGINDATTRLAIWGGAAWSYPDITGL